jgi:hypothetical protein
MEWAEAGNDLSPQRPPKLTRPLQKKAPASGNDQKIVKFQFLIKKQAKIYLRREQRFIKSNNFNILSNTPNWHESC